MYAHICPDMLKYVNTYLPCFYLPTAFTFLRFLPSAARVRIERPRPAYGFPFYGFHLSTVFTHFFLYIFGIGHLSHAAGRHVRGLTPPNTKNGTNCRFCNTFLSKEVNLC